VDLVPEKALTRPVTLNEIRRNSQLKEMPLLRCSRLSVQPVTGTEFQEVLRMAR